MDTSFGIQQKGKRNLITDVAEAFDHTPEGFTALS